MILGNSPDGQHPFGGSLNNVRLWSRSLLEEDIKAAMDKPVFGPGDTTLQVEVPFDEVSPEVVYSTEGKALLGTISGVGATTQTGTGDPGLQGVITFEADFTNGSIPASATAWGDAELLGNACRLTPDRMSQSGSLVIEDVADGLPVTGLTATFTARVVDKPATASEADGFSFSFAGDIPDGAFGEDGAGTGWW